MSKIEIRLVLPIPGRWTIETTNDGEFVLKNETDAPATVYIPFDLKIEEEKCQ